MQKNFTFSYVLFINVVGFFKVFFLYIIEAKNLPEPFSVLKFFDQTPF